MKPLGASDLVNSAGLNSAKNASKPKGTNFFSDSTAPAGDFSTQLSRAREQNLILARRYEQSQEEVERCHEQIARQAQQNVSLKHQNERLQAEIEELVVDHQHLM